MNNLLDSTLQWIISSFLWLGGLIESNLFTLLGFLLALVILLRVLREQRQPSSIIAWGGLIVLIPFLGVPLYLLFGGRKLKKRIRAKGKLGAESHPELNGRLVVHQHFQVDEGESRFCTDGQKAYANLCHGIEGAQRQIHLMTYILSADTVGKHVMGLLIRKAREGVQVRLLVDALGSFWLRGKWLKQLRLAGVEVHRFMPAFPFQTHGWANLRNHRKIAVFDKQLAIVGGRNIDLRFMGPVPNPDEFQDLSVTYRGEVVEYLNRIFLSDWAFAAKVPLESFKNEFSEDVPMDGEAAALTGIASGPDVQGDLLYDRIVNLVQESMESLTIVTPYFVPNEVLHRSLCIKARSGKRVRLIMPERSNWKVVDVARSFYLRELHASGVEIFLYQKGMLHAKVLSVDDRWILHGSANFDIRSLFVNFEIGMLHTSRNDAAYFRDWFERLLKDCRPFGLERELNPGWGRRLVEDITRLLAPLL